MCKSLESDRKSILKDFIDVLIDLLVEYPDAGDFGLPKLLICGNIIAHVYDLSVNKNLRTSIELLHYHSRSSVYALHTARYYKP